MTELIKEAATVEEAKAAILAELALPEDEAAENASAGQDCPTDGNDPAADEKVTQWLDFSHELTRPFDPVGPVQPPLWLNAADPCYLTADVGGLDRTPPAESPSSDAETAGAAKAVTDTQTKQKKAPKPRKPKAAAKMTDARSAGSPAFSDEEMERRQVALQLPPEREPAAPAAQPTDIAAPSPQPAAQPPATAAESPASPPAEPAPAVEDAPPAVPASSAAPASPKAPTGSPAPKTSKTKKANIRRRQKHTWQQTKHTNHNI